MVFPGSVASPGPAGDFTENAVSPLLLRCASPTRVDTERLAERETLLHRLGSKLNRTVLNSCGNSLSVAEKHVTFLAARFFCEQSHSHQKRSQKRKLTIFGNTKQVIQDYDTVFDNSIPLRKNDLLWTRITYFKFLEYRACRACTLCLGTEAAGVSVPPPRSPGRPQTSIT